jgi:hypothetical protein
MIEYITEKWSEVVVAEEVFSRAKQLASAAAQPCQLRIRVVMNITSYKKLEV